MIDTGKLNNMTQENKDLLLRDLSARLPYGVKCVSGVDDAILIIEGINPNCNGTSEVQVTYERSGINFDTKISSIKPYLRPMSSMTEEEKKEYYNLCIEEEREEIEFGEWITRVYYHNTIESIDLLNKNHFDYRDLIPLGLAKDATGLNIY